MPNLSFFFPRWDKGDMLLIVLLFFFPKYCPTTKGLLVLVLCLQYFGCKQIYTMNFVIFIFFCKNLVPITFRILNYFNWHLGVPACVLAMLGQGKGKQRQGLPREHTPDQHRDPVRTLYCRLNALALPLYHPLATGVWYTGWPHVMGTIVGDESLNICHYKHIWDATGCVISVFYV